jgi:hypothetical protein
MGVPTQSGASTSSVPPKLTPSARSASSKFGVGSEFGREFPLRFFSLLTRTRDFRPRQFGPGSVVAPHRPAPGKIAYNSCACKRIARLSGLLLIIGSLVRAQQAEPYFDRYQRVAEMGPFFIAREKWCGVVAEFHRVVTKTCRAVSHSLEVRVLAGICGYIFPYTDRYVCLKCPHPLIGTSVLPHGRYPVGASASITSILSCAPFAHASGPTLRHRAFVVQKGKPPKKRSRIGSRS